MRHQGEWFAWRPVRSTEDGGLLWLCPVIRQRERLWAMGFPAWFYARHPEAYVPTPFDWVVRAVLAAIILAGIADVVGSLLGGCEHLLLWGLDEFCPAPRGR